MRGHSRELACSQIIGMGSSEAIEAPEWHKDINEEDAIGKFDEPPVAFSWSSPGTAARRLGAYPR